MMEAAIGAAENSGAKVVYGENLYIYGRVSGSISPDLPDVEVQIDRDPKLNRSLIPATLIPRQFQPTVKATDVWTCWTRFAYQTFYSRSVAGFVPSLAGPTTFTKSSEEPELGFSELLVTAEDSSMVIWCLIYVKFRML
jgi:hypothetical protein